MAHVLKNLVAETAGNKPTGAQTFQLPGTTVLGGARAFSAEFTTGDTTEYYAVEIDSDGNPTGTAYEVGIGTLTTGSPWTMSRSVVESSNSDAAVDWSGASGSIRVYATHIEQRTPRIVHSSSIAASTASVDVTLRSGCSYLYQWRGLDMSNDAIIVGFRVGVGTVDSGATDYSYVYQVAYPAASLVGASTGASTIAMYNSFGNADVEEEAAGHAWIQGAGDSGTYTRIWGGFTVDSSASTPLTGTFGGARLTAQADTIASLLPASGTFSAGWVTVWEFPE